LFIPAKIDLPPDAIKTYEFTWAIRRASEKSREAAESGP